jgi:predicted nucleotidyltransferase
MAKKRNTINKDILNIIRDYIQELKKNNIHIRDVYLYGSYARNIPSDESDIDVAIISDSFSGDWFKDVKLLLRLRRHIDLRIEPFPFTSKDFNASQPMYYQIMKNGLKIV